MSAARFQPAIFPDLPRSDKIIEPKNGGLALTAEWSLFFQQMVQAMQTNLKPEGFVIPQQTATNIGVLTSSASIGNIIYDSTNNVFDGNILNTANSNTQAWYPFAMITSYAGNPGGNIPGFLNLFCYDTTDGALYICTTAGNAAGAVWTAV